MVQKKAYWGDGLKVAIQQNQNVSQQFSYQTLSFDTSLRNISISILDLRSTQNLVH